MCWHIKFTNTHRKWSFCNVCRCVRLKKSSFLATNTQKMAKHGPAKENKFNTVLCKLVNQLSGQRNQPQSDKDGQKISSVHNTDMLSHFFENVLDDYYSACTYLQLPHFKFMFEEIFFLEIFINAVPSLSTLRHTAAALHSYPPCVAQILSLVTWGVKMMSLCHGWGYHPIQTALYILMRYTIIWAFGMLSQGFMMGAPPWDHSTSQVGPWFGNSWSLMGKNDAIMSCLRLTFTSDTFPHPYEMYSNCLSFWYAVSRV